MTPWQQYLWTLAHHDEPPPVEDRPVVIVDECPATDGMTDEELMACAAARPRHPGPGVGRPGVPRVAPADVRCAAVVDHGGGDKARCRKPARAGGYCWSHRRWAGPPVASAGQG